MDFLFRILTITKKELLVLLARPMERRIIIIPPLILMFIFSWAATRDVKNIDAGIFLQDSGVWAQELIQRLDGSPTFRSLQRFNSYQELQQALDAKKVGLILIFSEDFSKNIEVEKQASLQVLYDGRSASTNQIVQVYLQKIVNQVSEGSPAWRENPVEVKTVFWFNPTLNYAWFYLPGLIAMINMMMSFIITGLSVAREKELGTFDQMLVSPATPTEIAIAKIIPGSLVALVHGTIFILQAYYLFHIPLQGSLLVLFAAIFIFSISTGGIGLMISSLASTQQQAFLGCFTVAVPLILLSGFAAPVINMPYFLQVLGELDPLKHFLLLIHGIFLKDVSLGQSMIYLIKITGIGAITTLAAILLFQKRL